MRRTVLTIVIMLTTITGLWAGGDQEEAVSPDRLTITLAPWTQRGKTLPENTPTELWLEEKFNVNLEPWYDVDDYQVEQKNVKLASGDIPDWLGSFRVGMVEIGVVRELDREFIRANMPGYMKQADYYLGEDVWRRTTVEGVNYGIPAALSMASTGKIMGFRADWLEAVGFDLVPVPDTDFYEGPQTVEEIQEVLLKFRNQDPDGNGKKDSYGWMVWKNNANFDSQMLPTIFGSFGVQWQVWDVRDGKAYYSMVDEKYREALRYVNTWWENEIIHPDSVTNVRKDFIQAITNNEFGAWSDLDAWQSNYTSTAGPWGALRANDPEIRFAFSVTPVGPTGGQGTWFRDPNWHPWCMGINASDAVAEKIMEIAEALHTDADLYARHMKGSEGKDWDWNADGYAVYRDHAKDPEYQQNQGLRMLSMSYHIVPPVDKVYIDPWRHKLQSFIEDKQVYGPGIGFHPTFNDEERALYNNLITIEQEFAWDALTGQIDVEDAWDGYVESMMAAGLDTLLDTVATQK